MDNSVGLKLLTVALAATLMLSSCDKTPEKSPPAMTVVGNVADADVTENVKAALHKDELTKGFYITVVTLNGDVRLTGEMENQTQIDEAVKIALASDGVHTIHNELTIKK